MTHTPESETESLKIKNKISLALSHLLEQTEAALLRTLKGNLILYTVYKNQLFKNPTETTKVHQQEVLTKTSAGERPLTR